MIQPSAGRMSCDFTSVVQESTFSSAHLPTTSADQTPGCASSCCQPCQPCQQPQLTLSPPFFTLHSHSLFLPPCLMALLLPQPMGPAALSLAEAPPFSSLIGRGGRGRGHGGGEALLGWASTTCRQTLANEHRQANTDKQTLAKTNTTDRTLNKQTDYNKVTY